jgi:hypothetical protein
MLVANASARTLNGPLRVPCLMDELQSIAVEVGNVGGVIAGGEVRAVGWLALVDTACFDRSCVRGIDSLRYSRRRCRGRGLSHPVGAAGARCSIRPHCQCRRCRHRVRTGPGRPPGRMRSCSCRIRASRVVSRLPSRKQANSRYWSLRCTHDRSSGLLPAVRVQASRVAEPAGPATGLLACFDLAVVGGTDARPSAS